MMVCAALLIYLKREDFTILVVFLAMFIGTLQKKGTVPQEVTGCGSLDPQYTTSLRRV